MKFTNDSSGADATTGNSASGGNVVRGDTVAGSQGSAAVSDANTVVGAKNGATSDTNTVGAQTANAPTQLVTMGEAATPTGVTTGQAVAANTFDLLQVSQDAITTLVSTIKDQFTQQLASITGQASTDITNYADAILPEMAKLQIIASSGPLEFRDLATRRLAHLKTQSLLDAARYGVRILQGSQQAVMAVLSTALSFGIKAVVV